MNEHIPVRTVQTDGFSMDYIRFGVGRDPLVVIPGLSVQSVMGSADAVAVAYGLLAERFTVYLFDRRKELSPSCSLETMARDTAAAMRALGLRDVCLFGVSQGGAMAMEIAIHAPELVRKLALGSTLARVTEDQRQLFSRWAALANAGDAEGLYLAFGEALYPEAVFAQARELLIVAARTVTENDLARFVLQTEMMRDYDITEDLRRISCPVLVIGSRDDRVLGPDASPRIAEKLNGRTVAELYMYDGYGHAVYDLAPDYKERLLRFFTAG